ncbi:hypothetical protein GUITHDRAFT_157086 [Guillardia theta CCMP2712]|uniref:Ferrochelatase n=1 Tax=Guillardia theta (strain CCMP2712) TaxID=905079 RepID=L1JWE9_GUITC|nr:hypothetical protein GUITHDRAFT_157086 [Guillardia theta CCMP2712]EKX52692.1 hypothetical protein GUITHDRAFT_157086 [Guillardia theta CCMP2712]|eukprot:XP_005839672.1 hypothetical protein GUITHDRAFT_157086 [Guillardia theta CCMP2712]
MATRPPTGVVLMNMGGPSTQEEVHPFLLRLFTDRQIMQLPMQKMLGSWIARRRSPKIMKQYAEIGGGSPIGKWTEIQGKKLERHLDEMCPETAPHKTYIAFRYASPLTEDAITRMKNDGVKRAVAFSQFPQWSCTTTGSSLNELWRCLRESGMQNEFQWSIIDRWHSHPSYIEALAGRILAGLNQFPVEDQKKVVFLFSAHSLPMKRVNAGDPYPQEVASTVGRVMEHLSEKGLTNPYILCWQSKVGPLPWLGPKTQDAIKDFKKQGMTHFMAIPVAFTTDHIETLYEIDMEFGEEAAKALFKRSPSFNDDDMFVKALADIAKSHLERNELCTKQYSMNCPGCVNPSECRSILNPIKPYSRFKEC